MIWLLFIIGLFPTGAPTTAKQPTTSQGTQVRTNQSKSPTHKQRQRSSVRKRKQGRARRPQASPREVEQEQRSHLTRQRQPNFSARRTPLPLGRIGGLTRFSSARWQ